jgi:hypothetical protein
MTSQDMQTLKDLLTEGLLVTEIRHLDKSRISPELDSYKNTLSLRWNNEYRDLIGGSGRDSILKYYPQIVDNIIENKLIDFILSHTSKYIDNDSIQSVEPIISGGAWIITDYSSRNLLTKLLNISIVYGVDEAVSKFQECVVNNTGSLLYIAVIDGIHLDHEIEIDNGVRLIPIPHDKLKIPIYMKNIEYADNLQNFFGKTLIVVDALISPALLNSFVGKGDFGDLLNETRSKIKIMTKSLLFPIVNMSIDYWTFCSSLSLICDSCIQIQSNWIYVKEDQLFNIDPMGSNSGASFPYGYIHSFYRSKYNIDDSDIQKAIDLCNKLINFNSSKERLYISIGRWIKSKAVENPIDKMIDLGVAFECIGLTSAVRNTEIKYKLGVHISRFLGRDKAHRIELMNSVQTMYDWRSTCVHTGKFSKKVKFHEIEDNIKKFQDLYRDCILKIIDNGEFPNWTDLIHD